MFTFRLIRSISFIVLLAVFAALALPAARPAFALGAISVTSLADDDPNNNLCTLREALQSAFQEQNVAGCTGAGSSPNIITFSGSGVIKLTNGSLPGINNNVTITGPITIDANKADRIFVVSANGTLNMGLVTLMNGNSGGGGAILSNGGSVNIAGSSFIGNHASSDGGVINSSGSVKVVASNFSGNKADGSGGAIVVAGGNATLTVAASNFNGNSAVQSGGALVIGSGGDVSDTIFSGNVATGDNTNGGGAIFNSGNGGGSKLTVVRVAFNGNLSPQGSGGALRNGSGTTALVSDSSFNGNIAGTPIANNRYGGAIFTMSGTQLALNRVTMLNNAAGGSGGAIANDKGNAIITNTSFTANAASSKGGGLFNFDSQQGGANPATVTLRNATFSTNAAALGGGGIYNDSSNDPFAVVTLGNTIVDNSDSLPAGGNCSGTLASLGHNLDSGTSCGFNQAGDLSSADPKLDIPFFNGGPLISLLTQKLKAGSAAIDAGDPAICAADPVNNLDQRNKPRPLDGNGDGNAVCDIGAFEGDAVAAGFGSTPVAPGPISVGSAVANSGQVQATFHVFNTGDAPLTVNTPTLGGPNASDFAVDPSLALTLNDATPTPVTVTCTPSAVGSRVASLSLKTNDLKKPLVTFSLSCIGTQAPAPAFASMPQAPGPVNIGNVLIGSAGSANVTLKNSGNAPLTVGGLTLGGANPSDFSVPAGFSATLDGGTTQNLQITCAPTVTGIRTASLSITTNDTNIPSASFTLTCTGAAVPPPVLETVGSSIGNSLTAGNNGPYGIAASPDGRHVYVADSGDNILTVYGRATDGTLVFLGGYADGSGGVSGMHGPFRVTVSPDGQNVYVASGSSTSLFTNTSSNSVVTFARNANTGLLTYVSKITKGQTYGFGDAFTLNALDKPYDVLISPDGLYAYVSSIADNTITVLYRNPTTGALYIDLLSGPVQTYTSADIDSSYGLALSPDGTTLYATGYGSHTVAVFSRNATTGKLTFIEKQVNGQNGVSGIGGVFRVTVSPDGAFVYTAAYNDSSVAVFRRDQTNGKLTFLASYTNGNNGIDGIANASAVSISPDGAYLYATGYGSNAVAIFNRDMSTGLLNETQVIKRNPLSGANPNPALGNPRDIAISPDGQSVHITSFSDNQVVTLRRANPVPQIDALLPASAVANSPDLTLIVVGSGFMVGSKVQWNGSERPTTFVNATQLKVTIPASDLAVGGPYPVSVPITVVNPAPGGGASSAKSFSILGLDQNPTPSIKEIIPSGAAAGSTEFMLTVKGNGFMASSKVQWNGSERPTTFVSATTLRAIIGAADIAQPGFAGVTVVNPAPGGGVSNAETFTIAAPGENPTPTILRLNPPSTTAVGTAGTALTLTVNGKNFTTDSIVQWNGSDRPTTFVDEMTLQATLTSADIADPGVASVTVTTPEPGGGTSNTATFTVGAVGDNPVPVADGITFATGAGGSTLTISGTGFVAGTQVLWNGTPRQVISVDGNQIVVSISNDDFVNAPAVITVVNPGPGGGESNELIFNVSKLYVPLVIHSFNA